ncbi:MAG TPA: cytochrome c [Gemmataceae bacterium]|nr:cytochrome c [Gemmataceae bacterium]
MRLHARLLALAVAGLVLGSYAAAGRADDKEDVAKAKDLVVKYASARENGDAAAAKKALDDLKKLDLEAVMHVFKPLEKGKGGVGFMPGAAAPNGIEAKIIGTKKELSKAQLDKEGKAWLRAAYIAEAVAQVTLPKCPVQKKMGDKDPKEWKQWAEEMKKSSDDLVKAIKAKDGKAATASIKSLNKACSDCHGPFRE